MQHVKEFLTSSEKRTLVLSGPGMVGKSYLLEQIISKVEKSDDWNQCLFDMEYFLLFLQNEQYAMKKKASGGVQSFVSLKFLRNYLLPPPPLAEQKRIVDKLEEILPLCKRLK